MTLFRATDSKYSGQPCGWQWWTPDREWAAGYGSQIIERSADDLSILDLPLDGPDVERALSDAGIEIDGIAFRDEDLDLDYEVHQILSDRRAGPLLAERIRAAGYDGVAHPDHVADRGCIGEAVALILE